MAQSFEALSRQNQTLSSIRGIVRTMKSLAVINAAPYEQAAIAIEAYQHNIERGFSAFAWRMRAELGHQKIPPAHRMVIAFGSDHGFCGNYNDLIARQVQAFCRQDTSGDVHVLCVGARLEAALQAHGVKVQEQLQPPASVDGVGRLAGEVVTQVEQYSRGQPLTSLTVHLAFTQRAEEGTRLPVVSRLLPLAPELLKAPQRWPSRALPDFSMPSAALLAALVRNYLFASVFRASSEAMVTENAARLALMQQAEQSVDDRLEQLKREMAGVRQDEITNELMDIVASI